MMWLGRPLIDAGGPPSHGLLGGAGCGPAEASRHALKVCAFHPIYPDSYTNRYSLPDFSNYIT